MQLVVGLGGLGCRVAYEAKQRLSKLYSTNCDTLAVIGIDCDSNLLKYDEDDIYKNLFIDTNDVSSVQKHLRNYATIASWMPSNVPLLNELNSGALGNFALGRLVFYLHCRDIENFVAKQVAILGSKNPGSSLHVTIISSMAGGVGGGMLIDVAYTIHRLLENLPITYSCDLALLASQRVQNNDTIATNIYAGLTELNHFMGQDTQYSIEFGSGDVWKSERAPFSNVFFFASGAVLDNREIDLMVRQVVNLAGASMDDGLAELYAEVGRRSLQIARHYDENGNPLRYYCVGSSSLYLPTNDLRLALASFAAEQVASYWLKKCFSTSAERQTSAGINHAESFLQINSLSVHNVIEDFNEAISAQHNLSFDSIIKRAEQSLRTKPCFKDKFLTAITDLETELDHLIDGQLNSHPLSDALEKFRQEYQQHICDELDKEVESIVSKERQNTRGIEAFATELVRRLSFSLNDLHEQLDNLNEQRSSLEEALKEAKDKARDFSPNALKRLFAVKRPLPEPQQKVIDTLTKLCKNRYDNLVARTILSTYLSWMDYLQQMLNRSASLRDVLITSQSRLQLLADQTRDRVVSYPDESMLTTSEIERLVTEQRNSDELHNLVLKIRLDVGNSLLDMPADADGVSWSNALVERFLKHINIPIPSLSHFFLERFPRDASRDKLRLTFDEAIPNLIIDSNFKAYTPPMAIDVACACLHYNEDGDDPDEATLLDYIHRLPQSADMDLLTVNSQDENRLSFLHFYGLFPLGAIDLNNYRQSYVQTLRIGQRFVHSRKDMRFHALWRPTITELTECMECLAIGVHFGNITDQGEHRNAHPDTLEGMIDNLYSPRWPDLASLKACLRLYEDPIEALGVENIFLNTLRRWQSEKLDENGVDGYIKSLASFEKGLSFLGMELDGPMRGALSSFERRLELKWPEWSQAITTALSKSPTVALNDLVNIPNGARVWTMNRYIKEHPDENLTYHTNMGVLELVSARDIEIFDRNWRQLQSKCENVGTFAEEAQHFVRVLCNTLGFTAGTPLTLNDLSGLQIGVHGLRIKLPKYVPMLVNRRDSLSNETVESLRLIMERNGIDSRFALLITFGSTEEAIAIVNERLRSLLRYDVIVLGYNDLRDILAVRSRLKKLVQIILRQVDLTVVSPFITEGPVPASMFFGREGEIREILTHLESTSVALVGPRRIGKTSTMQRVLASLNEHHQPIVYVDCQSIFDANSFMQMLVDEYAPSLQGSDLSMQQLFRRIVDKIADGYHGLPVKFILDEVDLMLREDCDGSDQLFRTFKSVSQSNEAYFLFCGERTLLQRIHDSKSALYNFCYMVRVQFLNDADAAHLITEPLEQMEITWEDRNQAIATIMEVTSGHPNLIQRTCASLVQRLNDEKTRLIKNEFLQDVIHDPDYVEEFLDTLWGRADELEKIICLALEEDDHCSAPEVRTILHERYAVDVEMPMLVEALDNICLYGILEKHSSRYSVVTKYLTRLLHELMDISEEIQLHKEMMQYGN